VYKKKKEDLVIKYQTHLREAPGGIFSKKARDRLLGIARPYGGEHGKTLANFWNRIRTYVSNALVDLEFFIETADYKQVKQVINLEALEPLIKTYFQLEFGETADTTIEKVAIADYMVYAGFEYLRHRKIQILDYEKKKIEEAVILSNFLAQRIARAEDQK
jgi:hypothetical protein